MGNFQRFLDKLDQLQVDWQMGVTTTNMTDGGKLRRTTLGKTIIKKGDLDAQANFTELTTFPMSRARWEQGLRMAQFAVSSPNIDPGGPNAGLLRKNAALALIVVSNEDDCSFGSADYYARAFHASKGHGNETLVTFSAIVGTTPQRLRLARRRDALRRAGAARLPLRVGGDQDRRGGRLDLRPVVRGDPGADRRGAQHPAARLPAHA